MTKWLYTIFKNYDMLGYQNFVKSFKQSWSFLFGLYHHILRIIYYFILWLWNYVVLIP